MSTDDQQLSSLYRAAGDEQPPKHLDNAILAAARRETSSRPHPAFSPFSSNWKVPASLAAVLVLSVSIVLLVDDQDAVFNGIEEDVVASSPAPGIIKQDQPTKAKPTKKAAAPDKPALRRRLEEDRREQPASKLRSEAERQLAFRAPATVKQEQPPASVEEKAIVGRSSLQDSEVAGVSSLQATEPALATADALAPNIIEVIRGFRLEGKLAEANQAADAYIKHYFADGLASLRKDEVKPANDKLKQFIAELRSLGREKDAEQLEKQWLK